MNQKYLETIYKENEQEFKEKSVESVADLEYLLIDYLVNNMLYDFDIELDLDKLFHNDKCSGKCKINDKEIINNDKEQVELEAIEK